jgi:TetR/AcrR family transcriptional regulator, mexJK operon transcriptional repressor
MCESARNGVCRSLRHRPPARPVTSRSIKRTSQTAAKASTAPDEALGRLSAEKRAAIVKSAMTMFLEHGYARTTMDELARHAGVSSRTLFKHFPTKPDLFEHCVVGMIQAAAISIDAAFASASPPETARVPAAQRQARMQAEVSSMVRAYAQIVLAPEPLAFSRLMISEAGRHPQLAATADATLVTRIQSLFAQRIRSLQQQGVWLPEVDAERAAHDLICLVSGFAAYPALFGAPGLYSTAPEELVEHIAAFVCARYAPTARPGRSTS